jgi:hypothetical protein
MNVWLVTIGNSDVRLTDDESWSDWLSQIKNSLYRLRFEPVRAIEEDGEDGEPYRLPARVLAIAHDRLPDQVQPYLSFPLLQNFTQKLKAEDIQIDRIIVLLSDQENIFSESERETKRCPYWQDTCQLYPILEDYLGHQFPDAIVEPLLLQPKFSEPGLDNWDAVLELVQQEIQSLKFETEPQTVYVSHQAGTPAISSAVQFCSLAKFGDRVRFLVSSEQSTQPPSILPSSSYLKGIHKKEAEALLKRHNYAGVEVLLRDYLKDQEETKSLLNAAIQWNVAKFDKFLGEFVKELSYHPKFQSEVEERTRKENWWWIAYEEVYLAVIREKQDNIVDAFFHSFRAFEYIFSRWGSQKLIDYIEEGESDSVSFIKESLLDDPNIIELSGKSKKSISGIISKLKKIRENKLKADPETGEEEKVEFVFFNLANLFKAFNYSEYKSSCQELEIFFGKGNVRDRRNAIVHQVKGLSVVDLCNYWGISCSGDLEDIAEREKNIEKWKSRLVNLLNFIIKEDFPQGFESIEAASLMAKVHQELEKAIDAL